MKTFVGIVAAVAVTLLSAGFVSAATMPGDVQGLKSIAPVLAQKADYYRPRHHCWWKHGHKHCN
jgi:hypothetical protein